MTYEFDIKINPKYARSINIERDAHDSDLLDAFVLTDRALEVVSRVDSALKGRREPKAWALVGPYGSGKSMLALYLSDLYSARSDEEYKAALRKLRNADQRLGDRVGKYLEKRESFLTVSVSGAPEPLRYRLVRALAKAAKSYWEQRPGRAPKVVQELEGLAGADGLSLTEVVDGVASLRNALRKVGSGGLLLQIDELGKFLEYEAKQPALEDLFLLQMLAEASVEDEPCPLTLTVMLHQAFEAYGKAFSGRQKSEWQKIQGRFELIPYVEGTEQALRVLSSAISQGWDKEQKQTVTESCRGIAEELNASGISQLSGSIDAQTEVFSELYPLHPLSALLLPGLCNRLAQNERTLFSFLSSTEPGGFRQLLRNRSEKPGIGWILPHEIYDYFVSNTNGAGLDPVAAKRWSEVVTAEERFNANSELPHHLFRAIGLLNIHGAHKGLRASREVLEIIGRADEATKREVSDALGDIRTESVATYRKFSGEFRVWQGSDVDIDSLVQEELDSLSDFDAVEELNNLALLQPIVARRHSLKTGAMRYYSVQYVGPNSAAGAEHEANPNLYVSVSDDRSKARDITKRNRLLIAARAKNPQYLIELTRERRALARLLESRAEFRDDAVARKEIETRLHMVAHRQKSEANRLLTEPNLFEWFHGGKKQAVKKPTKLQQFLSDVLDEVFEKSPRIRNELVNRDKVSSSAAAGRKRVFSAALVNSDKEDLGIEGYPAEKAIYRSVYRASRFHGKSGGIYRFKKPTSKNDHCNLLPVINFVRARLMESTDPFPLDRLFSEISKPPFGVKRGLHSLLFVLIYFLNKGELALYEEGVFAPDLDFEAIERLTVHPELFSAQIFHVKGINEELYRTYEAVAIGEASETPNILSVARPIVGAVRGVSDFAKQTSRISTEARAVREAVLKSRSPGDLLFKELPAACGFSEEQFVDRIQSFESFKKRLLESLSEIYRAQQRLDEFVTGLLSEALFKKEGMSLEELMHGCQRFNGLQNYTIDRDGLLAFINRLTDEKESEKAWYTSVATFLARKPPEKWRDEDVQIADARLAELARRLRDLETLRVQSERWADRGEQFTAILVKIIDQVHGECEDVIPLDARDMNVVEAETDRLVRELEDSFDHSIRTGILVRAMQRMVRKDDTVDAPNRDEVGNERG